MVLAGYGGMVSMAQLTVAGVAGYAVAILGPNSTGVLGLNWPWWIYAPLAILIAGIVSALIGAIAVRTAGIYTIMITLATVAAFFYLAQQNYSLFNGHSGFRGVAPPDAFGVSWRKPVPFYYLSLAVAALCYSAVVYASRSPFGLTLMASRDNPRRARAVGHNVAALRIAAFLYAGLFAHGYYIEAKAMLAALDKVKGDLSGNEAKFRDALAHLELDTPTGKVKLDKNRQAIADNYLTEVATAGDGHLYNKVVKVIPAVNQTLGIPEADFMKLGVANRDNPDCK